MKRTIRLWNGVPGHDRESTLMEYYPAADKKTEAAVVILPGGGYTHHADHEGRGYAEYLNSLGMDAFVVYYSVWPNAFPLPLLDARRAMRYIRRNSVDFGVDPRRIAVMGSSAGGHLAALLANYVSSIDGEDLDYIDTFPYRPDATILCYSLITVPREDQPAYHCFQCLCGESTEFSSLSADRLVTEKTPSAFIFHTSRDSIVDVRNSYAYAAALKRNHVPFEMHIFEHGSHGGGTFTQDPYVGKWTKLLENWLISKKWLNR